jgi:hypothetical protein
MVSDLEYGGELSMGCAEVNVGLAGKPEGDHVLRQENY